MRVALACLAALVLVGTASASGPFLRVSVRGSGTVTGVPGVRACSKTCSAAVRLGATVRLTAKPAAGWRFAGWQGWCHGTKPICVLKLTVSKKVGATFTKVSPPLPPAPPSGFTPALITGTWNGTWANQTYGTSGSAQFVVATPTASSFTFQVKLGGNVFGCSTPPATSGEIAQGTGQNHWNADGFSIQTTTAAGGSATIAYDFKANQLTGNGVSGCNPGITWTIKGSFNGNTFNGTVSISLPGGITATSVLTVTR